MSTEVVIPDHLTPKREIEKFQVPIAGSAKVQFSLEELKKLESELDLTRMNSADMATLAKIGVQSQALGIMDSIHGSFMLTRGMLMKQIYDVSETIQNGGLEPMDLDFARKSFALLVSKLTQMNLTQVKVDATKATVEIAAEQVRVQASWSPGAVLEAKPVS